MYSKSIEILNPHDSLKGGGGGGRRPPKYSIKDLLQIFLLVFAVVNGFFFEYACVWFLLGLPEALWSTILLALLAGLSTKGLFRWIAKG